MGGMRGMAMRLLSLSISDSGRMEIPTSAATNDMSNFACETSMVTGGILSASSKCFIRSWRKRQCVSMRIKDSSVREARVTEFIRHRRCLREQHIISSSCERGRQHRRDCSCSERSNTKIKSSLSSCRSSTNPFTLFSIRLMLMFG